MQVTGSDGVARPLVPGTSYCQSLESILVFISVQEVFYLNAVVDKCMLLQSPSRCLLLQAHSHSLFDCIDTRRCMVSYYGGRSE